MSFPDRVTSTTTTIPSTYEPLLHRLRREETSASEEPIFENALDIDEELKKLLAEENLPAQYLQRLNEWQTKYKDLNPAEKEKISASLAELMSEIILPLAKDETIELDFDFIIDLRKKLKILLSKSLPEGITTKAFLKNYEIQKKAKEALARRKEALEEKFQQDEALRKQQLRQRATVIQQNLQQIQAERTAATNSLQQDVAKLNESASEDIAATNELFEDFSNCLDKAKLQEASIQELLNKATKVLESLKK